MQVFEKDNYSWISKLVEEKIPLLKQNEDFSKKYKELTEKIECFENNLQDEKKEEFQKIINLIYETEEYYFILSYFLGAKFGEELKQI